jgi:hypothetical protein
MVKGSADEVGDTDSTDVNLANASQTKRSLRQRRKEATIKKATESDDVLNALDNLISDDSESEGENRKARLKEEAEKEVDEIFGGDSKNKKRKRRRGLFLFF